MSRWFLLLLGLAACATGVTEGGVDDDGGGGAASGGDPTSSTSIATGGTASVGGNSTGGVGGSGATGTGGATTGDAVWINELHYDNDSTDSGEGVELAGTAGLDLSAYEVVLYNQTGATYSTPILATGVIPDQGNGFGAVWFAKAAIQNGDADALALVSGSTVIQFLSYEGTVTAIDGPASGMTSVDIGVAEEPASSVPVGQSLQLTGTGNAYSDFAWGAAATATPGQSNGSQTFQ